MKTRLRRLIVNSALVAASLAGGLLAIEGGLWAIDYEYSTLMQESGAVNPEVPSNNKAAQFTQVLTTWKEFKYDPDLFWSPRPNNSVFNELGLRGPVWGPKQDGDPIRVLTIGDSNTLGFIRATKMHWPGFVQQHFDEGKVQVVNAGVYGHAAYQGLLRFKSLLSLEPDFVTISFGANDGHHRGFDDQQYAERIAPFKPWASLRLADLLLRAYDIVLPLGDQGDRRPRVPLEHYRQHLEEMISLCRANGIKCLLLTRPFNPADAAAQEKLAADPLFFIAFVGDYNDLTRRIAQETGTPLLDVAAIFENKPWLFTDSSHFKVIGQRILGDLVAGEIAESFPEARAKRRALYLATDITAFDGMHPGPDVPQWSKSKLRIDLSKLTLRPGDTRVVLSTRGWRHFDEPRDVGLRLRLDGHDLTFLEKREEDFHFALPAGIQNARQLFLTIDTFEPGSSDDGTKDARALGLDLIAIRLM